MFAAFILLLWPTCLASNLQDPTREPGASGVYVVDLVVDRIKQCGVFPSEAAYLRRMAKEGTDDGQAAKTYRPTYDGGIWQIDKEEFDEIKTSETAKSLFSSINTKFAIDWGSVQWVDLRKPLYSGLAAALYLTTLLDDPHTVEDDSICKNAPATGDYYFPHPTDPHKYYQCDPFGDSFLKTCPDNKIWHPENMQCIPNGLFPAPTGSGVAVGR